MFLKNETNDFLEKPVEKKIEEVINMGLDKKNMEITVNYIGFIDTLDKHDYHVKFNTGA